MGVRWHDCTKKSLSWKVWAMTIAKVSGCTTDSNCEKKHVIYVYELTLNNIFIKCEILSVKTMQKGTETKRIC